MNASSSLSDESGRNSARCPLDVGLKDAMKLIPCARADGLLLTSVPVISGYHRSVLNMDASTSSCSSCEACSGS